MSLLQKSKELAVAPTQDVVAGQAKKVSISVGESVYIRPFTDVEETVKVHYLSSKGVDGQQQGYFQCLGEDCPACVAGVRSRELDLLPVYNADDEEIQVLQLPVSPDARSQALSLRNQVLRVFRELPETFSDYLVPIDRKTAWEHVVGQPQPLGNVDEGEEAISTFQRLSAEERSTFVRSVIRKLSKDEIASSFPVVKNRLARIKR